MGQEFRTFAVTIPAGTLITAPAVTPLTMPTRLVRKVRFRIPPGPAGQVGFALGAAGVRVIPWGPNQWIVGDGEVIEWDVDDQIESGAWQFQGYNQGRWDHTIQVQFVLDLVTGQDAAGPPGLLDLFPA